MNMDSFGCDNDLYANKGQGDDDDYCGDDE